MSHDPTQMSVPATMKFDAGAIRCHVEMIHELATGQDGIIPLCVYGEDPDSGRKTSVVRHFRVGDADKMASAILAYEKHPDANIYAPLAVMKKDLPRGKKGSEQDIISVLGTVVDDDADNGKNARYLIEPNCVLRTSSVPVENKQSLVLFDRPLSPAEAKPLAIALQRSSGCDHGTQDLSHVWRIAGTANWPNREKVLNRNRPREPQMITVLQPWLGELTSVDRLRKLLAPYMGGADKMNGHTYRPADVGDVMARLDPVLRKAIEAPSEEGEDRSQLIASAVVRMIKVGLTDIEIESVISAHPDGIGEKFVDRNDLAKEIWRLREKFGRSAAKEFSQVIGDGLESLIAADLEMQGLTWFWPGRFALGKIGIIGGLPDLGKGQLCCFAAAAATANIDLPCGEGKAAQGNVIWFNAEDDPRDTVIPRLVAAGADLSRIHFIKATRGTDGASRMFSLVNDLHLLRMKIEEIGNVILVIFDPLSAYLGVGKVDSRSTADIRSVLSPLKEMAEELGLLILAILHFNKKEDVKNALLRIADSLAFTAAARHVYAVLEDPDDGKKRLFVKAKNNLAPRDQKALRYGFGFNPRVGYDIKHNVDIGAPFIEWSAEGVEVSANDVMQAAASGRPQAKREARTFLLDRLANGPVPADDLLKEAEEIGIPHVTLRRAKKDLRIVSTKPLGSRSGWLWKLSPPEEDDQTWSVPPSERDDHVDDLVG